jgi:hypothetical protein
MRLSHLAFLLILSCGKRVEAYPPLTTNQEIDVQIGRILPELVRCDGAPAKFPCDSVERQSDNWGLYSYFRIGFIDQTADAFALASIREDGKPFRSPAHRAAGIDSFSRDHMISMAMWTLAYGDANPLRSVIAYASRNNWKVCGLDKCLLSPGLLNVLGDVASRFGQKRPFGTNVPDYVAEAQITIDANSGGDCSLVLDTVYLKAHTGNLTTTYINAAKTCDTTSPSLYSRYIVALTATGDYSTLQQDVLAEMRAWQPNTEGPHFSRNGSGFALVALGRLVQK